jgi:hypothetical protein
MLLANIKLVTSNTRQFCFHQKLSKSFIENLWETLEFVNFDIFSQTRWRKVEGRKVNIALP